MVGVKKDEKTGKITLKMDGMLTNELEVRMSIMHIEGIKKRGKRKQKVRMLRSGSL